MTNQKTKIGKLTLLAGFLPFLLFGLSSVLFPDATTNKPPTPMPVSPPETLLDQLLWTFNWLGLATLVAFISVGVILVINRILVNRRKKSN